MTLIKKEKSLLISNTFNFTFTGTTGIVNASALLNPTVLFNFQKERKLKRIWGTLRPQSGINGSGSVNCFLKLLNQSSVAKQNYPSTSSFVGFVPSNDVLVNVGTSYQTTFDDVTCCGYQIDSILLGRSGETAAGSSYQLVLCFEFLDEVFEEGFL